jgi:predicted RNase H-like nuclease (RuvC/YqgF family)
LKQKNEQFLQQFQTENDNLQKEIDSLKTEKENLIKELNDLLEQIEIPVTE